MKVLIVYAHPNPESFNHAILETVDETLTGRGHETRIKDLYAEGFDPVLDAGDFEELLAGNVPEDIRMEQEDVAWADALVFVYPIWWFGRPAILKGWIDRVFLPGFAFRMTEAGPIGLLEHRKALVLQTTGGAEEVYRANDAVGVIQRAMTDGTLRFTGIADIAVKTFFGVPTAGDEGRRAMLRELEALLADF